MKILIPCVLLAGCAGMLSPEPPPADWPELQYTTIYAPVDEMLAACAKLGVPSPGAACALIDFDRKLCSIIFRNDRPMEQHVFDHEYEHCLGREDLGDDRLKRALKKWKASNE